jgi:hypothetical protein
MAAVPDLRHSLSFLIFICLITLISINTNADYFSYNGSLSRNIKRDRIIAISEDFATLYYYMAEENTIPTCTGATPPDTVTGWKTGMKYCWGGETTTRQFLEGIELGLLAGNRNTGASSYGKCSVGADCSGFVSNAWTSPRRATSGFPAISDDISWEQLRIGDALNNAGSHIRLFDYYLTDVGTAMLYEATGSGWSMRHRSLARSSSYQPIRYNYTYNVYNYPEPVITYIRRSDIGSAELRWDGQADTGFRLYISRDGSNWDIFRDTNELTIFMRVIEITGLLPDVVYYFKMTSVNSDGETISSPVAAFRDSGRDQAMLIVDGADRYRDQESSNHNFIQSTGFVLNQCSVGFDFTSNEAVVDEQISLSDYDSAIWILAEESTIDETFSWPEQMHITNFLKSGGRIFVSGSEIAWDLDNKADSTTYKNGSINDKPFCNEYLRSQYIEDDSGKYSANGIPGTIFEGLNITFDDGTHGIYNVDSPDVIKAFGTAVEGLEYPGVSTGAACVYESSVDKGTVVNAAFGFESIYPDSSKVEFLKRILALFDQPPKIPTIKSAIKTGTGELTISWEGDAAKGFRLLQKIGSGTWSVLKDENTLGPYTHSIKLTEMSASDVYSFKIQSVNSTTTSNDSDVLSASPVSGIKILVVDGYDRWNSQEQSNGINHVFLERYAKALSANNAAFDSCTNEETVLGNVDISKYKIIIWMSGEESTRCETFSLEEQLLLQDYLKSGGKLFVSGAEIGWDLEYKGGDANDHSNGSDNDILFLLDFLKVKYSNDDAGTYNVNGISGSIFEGLSFSFDNGTNGSYNVEYPDVYTVFGGSSSCLSYSTSSSVAGITYTGFFNGGTREGKIVTLGFPFETIVGENTRSEIIKRILDYFGTESIESGNFWLSH